jgi:hypothetical protein
MMEMGGKMLIVVFYNGSQTIHTVSIPNEQDPRMAAWIAASENPEAVDLSDRLVVYLVPQTAGLSKELLTVHRNKPAVKVKARKEPPAKAEARVSGNNLFGRFAKKDHSYLALAGAAAFAGVVSLGWIWLCSGTLAAVKDNDAERDDVIASRPPPQPTSSAVVPAPVQETPYQARIRIFKELGIEDNIDTRAQFYVLYETGRPITRESMGLARPKVAQVSVPKKKVTPKAPPPEKPLTKDDVIVPMTEWLLHFRRNPAETPYTCSTWPNNKFICEVSLQHGFSGYGHEGPSRMRGHTDTYYVECTRTLCVTERSVMQ